MTPEDLIAAFETIAEAPDGVGRLRELILQLAVRGRLVPQDREDGSAQTLLQRIGAGAASGRKSRAKITYEREHPFDTPSTWEWVYLGVAIGLVNGKAFKSSEWAEDGLPIVRIQNLNSASAPFNYCDFEVKKKYYVSDGDLLLSWSGTPGTSFGAFLWDRGPAVLNQHIFRCQIRGGGYYPPFLRLAVNSRLEEMIEQAHGGVGLRHITKGKLEGLWLALPPLAEQRRIVARVDELMTLLDRLQAARDAREATRVSARDSALASLKEAGTLEDVEIAWTRVSESLEDLLREPEDVEPFRQTVLELAVRGRLVPQDPDDDPAHHLLQRLSHHDGVALEAPGGEESAFALPASWAWCRFGDVVVEGPRNGWSPKTVEYPTGTRTLKLSATTSGRFDANEYKFVDATPPLDSPLWLRSGDLLIQRSNTPRYVGMAAIYEGPSHRFIFPDLMMRCRVSTAVSVKYIHLCLIAPFNRRWFATQASGTSQSMVKINQATVKSARIPLAPPQEQARIVAKVERLMGLMARLESAFRKQVAAASAFSSAASADLPSAGDEN